MLQFCLRELVHTVAVRVLCGGLFENGETEQQGWSTERPKE
jgi:hypothetical protein